MTEVAILIPAAGASRRMRGTDKLLERVDGQPLLRLVAEQACTVAAPVIVTLAEDADTRAKALDGLSVRIVLVKDAAEGMSASLRAAARAVPDTTDGLLIRPADMPDLTADDLRHVISAFVEAGGKDIVQGTGADGTPGHPVVFPISLVRDFDTLSGDAGARSILKAHRNRVRYVPLPQDHALTDLDTPEDWAAWRARNPGR
ncbi:nucleotidyltransferase family protein [Marivita hallyeonensis]|uniref:CTP:molybdopterin cytidylyltransferase MocA n=1 Tax=Marivita hallyeonensis TaxID=996342 RepID=A0A1M5VJD9_9RHOB|nr:nucleotidyltransferase family protein [Marivita hallyeonensis]SHH75341.1 CTP:molybdopterin cytidylyltransferase MocA [Marivita hallyeonensis]